MDNIYQTGYALKANRLVHVSDVPRGQLCGCTCVSCHLDLIAKKGAKRRHHFAHKSNSLCDGGIETALHLLAKEIFQQIDQFSIPTYNFHMERKTKSGINIIHDQLVAKGGDVSVDEVSIECAVSGFVPDIVIASRDRKLLIEVAVTHQVDKSKMSQIRKYGFPAIEIRLPKSDALLTRAELEEKLRFDVDCKHWLFHPLQKDAEAQFFAKFRSAIRDNRKESSISPTDANKRPKWIPAIGSTENDRVAFDKAGSEFFRKHDRWPSMDECLRLWPWMRK